MDIHYAEGIANPEAYAPGGQADSAQLPDWRMIAGHPAELCVLPCMHCSAHGFVRPAALSYLHRQCMRLIIVTAGGQHRQATYMHAHGVQAIL